MKHLKLFFALFAMLALGVGNAWAEEATVYTSNVELSTTGGTKATASKAKISNVEYSAMKLGSSGNAGNFYVNLPANTTSLTLHAAAWNGKTSNKLTLSSETAGVTISPSTAQTLTANSGVSGSSTTYTITPNNTKEFFTFTLTGATSGAKIKLACNERCLIWGVNAETAGGGETPGEGGGEDPVDPTPGTGGTGTINFNSNAVKISSASVTGQDNLNNTWTITTVGTTSFTSNSAYYQVGSSTKPATSITFTTTLPQEGTVTDFSAKFGGFSNTKGNVTLKVDDTSVGTGSLNGTSDVVVENSSEATGKTLTVTVTGIAKGVKVYYISYTYTTASSGDEPETPKTDLTDAQFAWSAATAEATMGASNTFPTLTNTLPVSVTYESSTPATATIAADGTITLVAPGTTTISAKFAGGEVSGTTYAPKTVTYALTVLKAPATPTSTVYVKVTSTAGITDGEYLIVYEDASNATPAPVAFNGALTTLDAVSNNIAVTISSNTIAGNTDIDAATFTIDATAKTVKSKSGYYIGQTSDANGLKANSSTAYENALSIENDGTATVKSGGAYLRYNSDANNWRFRYYKSSSYSGQKAIALYKKASKHTVTIADCTNGSVSAKMGETALATNDQVLSGIQITLSNTPSPDYKLSAYHVYKTGEESTKVTETDGKFIMPEHDVTISATFVPAKTLTSIEITTPATQTTFWQGEEFNHDGLKVTAHFNGAADEDVTDKVTVTGSTATAGAAVDVTVSFTEGTVTETATYTITVKAIPNTKETAYSVAEAYDIIDKLTTAEGVFISGIISQVDSYNSTYKSITYWISADGTTTNQLQVYSGKGLESADFAAVTDLSVGDQVIVCGNLKKYSGTYEFDKNNYLASHTPTTKDPAGLSYATTSYTANVGEAFTTPELNNPHNLVVTYSTSDASKATVDSNTGAVTIVAAGEVTITASTTGDATHDAGSASYTITISNPAMAVATLPFAFDNGKVDIENTPGMSQGGLGSDYTSAGSPKLKFDHTDDYVIIHFNGEPGKLSYDIKGNSYSGSTFTVQESEDGSAYTNIVEYTELGSTETKTHTLAATSRYVKFIYTEKVNGNVALGNIKIALPEEEPEQPGGGETPEERLTDWVLTPLADITTNDLVVITMTKGETTWAMTNNNGTSAAPAAPVVTLSADALAAEPAENLKWVVSNNNGTLTIYPYGDYETWLYSTTSNNGIRVGKSDNKTFKIDDDYGYLYNIATYRYVGVYDNADWRSYTSMHANISDQTLAFYVKKNANDVLPGTGEEPEEPGDDPVVPTPTINPTATFIFNTAEGLNDLGITYPVTPTTVEDGTEDAFKTEFENNATFTQDGITMTTTGGTVVATRVWLTAAGKLDLRVYKGATLTFSVPAEHKISAIVFDGSNIGHLLVNGNAVSGNAWTGSAQTITFTAKDDAKTIKINTIAFVVEYTRDVTNTYGTICLPHASASTSGAYFYEVVGKGTENGKPAVYLASVNSLKAGVPYIFEATGSQINVALNGEAVANPVNEDANGLIGTFTNDTEVAVGNYILLNNELHQAAAICYVNAYRAYLNLSAVDGGKPNQMPGRRYIGMSVQGENEATGVEDIFSTNAPVKVIENGQLIIIRDGVKYNVQGQRL